MENDNNLVEETPKNKSNTGIIIVIIILILLIIAGVFYLVKNYYLDNDEEDVPAEVVINGDVAKWMKDVQSGTVVTVLGTTLCPHCKEYKPVIKELAEKYNLNLYYFSIDELNDQEFKAVTETFDLEHYNNAVPFTFVVKDGKVITDTTGFSSKEETEDFIKNIDNPNKSINSDYEVSIDGNTFTFSRMTKGMFDGTSICELSAFNELCKKYIDESKNDSEFDEESSKLTYIILDDKNSIIDADKIVINKKYSIVDEEEYFKKNVKSVFTKGNYTFYENIYSDEDSKGFDYIIIDSKEHRKYDTYKFNDSDSLYIMLAGDSLTGIFDVNKKLINTDYSEYSCEFHSDIQTTPCSSEITMVAKSFKDSNDEYYEKFGLFDLKNFKTIVEPKYDSMYNFTDYFLVKNNNKYGIIDSKGKEILKIEYDYIGADKYLGILAIKGNDIEVYDEKLNAIDLTQNPIKTLYESALKDTNDADSKKKAESLTLAMPESWYWTLESDLGIYDINKPFDYDSSDGTYSLKYTGNKYSGKQLILRSVCTGPFMYVIEDNKAYKIDKKDLKEGYDEGTCF